MLGEVIDKLRVLSVDAATVKATELVTDDPAKRLFIDSRGNQFEIPRAISSRKHTVADLASMLESVKLWGNAGTLWHDVSGVKLVINDAVRRETVDWTLEFHDRWELIESWNKQTAAYDQRQALQLLKNVLTDCVPQSVVDAVRAVDAAYGGRKVSEISAGREKGMAEFGAQLANEVPEKFPCVVPIYTAPDFQPTATVTICLDVVLPPQPLQFRFSVQTGDVDRELHQAQQQLHALLLENEHEIPVLYGRP